jgi:hypothetical protein
MQLYGIALFYKLRRGTNERKRRLGTRMGGPIRPAGSKLKRAALRHKRHATWG